MRTAPALAVLGTTVLAACGGTGSAADVDCERFAVTAAAWSATDRPDESEERLRRRRQFADGIVECDILAGAPRSAVRRLLGDDRNDDPQLPDNWAYYVGPERSPFVLDDEYLSITFKDDRVVTVRLTTG